MERVGFKDVPRKFLAQEEKTGFLKQGNKRQFLESEKDLGLGKEDGGASLLDGLLAKAEYDGPSVVGKRKKKRKGKDQSQNFSL